MKQTEILEYIVQQSTKGKESFDGDKQGALREFRRLKPPVFQGSANPIEAKDWLTEIEKSFDAMHCPDEEKVTLATFMLQGGAFDWWTMHKKKYPEGYLFTWESFKEEFYRKYFPESVQRKMELSFLQLKQDQKSVAEYEIEFSRLARYASVYVQNDEAKARRFAQGLRQPIKSRVEVFELKSFRDVANKALTVEQAYVEEQDEVEQQRKRIKVDHGNQGNIQKKMQQNWRPNNRPVAQPRRNNCVICHGNHTAFQCEYRHGKCFRCGREGHMISQCHSSPDQNMSKSIAPKPLPAPKAPLYLPAPPTNSSGPSQRMNSYSGNRKQTNSRAKVNHLTRHDADEDNNVITGKANVVADALSRKTACNMACLITTQRDILRDMEKLGIEVYVRDSTSTVMALQVKPDLQDKIRMKQMDDPFLLNLRKGIEQGKPLEFHIRSDGSVWLRNRICVPDQSDLKLEIMQEAHSTPYTVHPGSTKM
ncbi:uncharacterized protein [Aegilops tauschii subsp. strangulata]|uniref:uncharacterized protein n=1 Tax=Aegilops tauschii subsp. strangulata TaxID=200361 RepID=UPI003CC8572A